MFQGEGGAAGGPGTVSGPPRPPPLCIPSSTSRGRGSLPTVLPPLPSLSPHLTPPAPLFSSLPSLPHFAMTFTLQAAWSTCRIGAIGLAGHSYLRSLMGPVSFMLISGKLRHSCYPPKQDTGPASPYCGVSCAPRDTQRWPDLFLPDARGTPS